MKLTIALANYNRAWYLDRSIRLIGSQTIPQTEWELIIVDDGSTDQSDAVIRHHKSHGAIRNFHYARRVKPRTRYGNCAIARNIGARLGSGNIILFSDPEVMPMPDWTAQHVATLCDNPIHSTGNARYSLVDPTNSSWKLPVATDHRLTMGRCFATRENHVIEGEFVRPGLGNVFADYDWLDMPETWKRIHEAVDAIRLKYSLTARQIDNEFYFYRFSCGGVSVSRALFNAVRGFEEDFANADKGLDVWSGEEVVFLQTVENQGAKWIEEPSARSIHIHHNISTDGGKGNAYGFKYCLDHPGIKEVNIEREWGDLSQNGYEQIF